jgi:hypothetical protein
MGWRFSRYAALLAVLALHALLLLALMMWRGGIRIAAPGRPLEIAFLSPNTSRDKITPPPLQTSPDPRSKPTIDAPTIIMLPPQAGEAGLPPVNWAAEARQAAESAAKSAVAPAPKPLGSMPSAGSEWFPAPKHHAGEMVPGANGDVMVFTNENCYQVIPVIPPVVDATHNGMGLQTYCLGGSKEPRGDLFKDLEAYKKLHPEK